MTQTDDGMLLAYLDGELALPEAEALEAELERSPSLARRLAAFAGSTALLRAALAPATHGRMPALREPPFDAPASEPPARRKPLPLMAAAASVALMIGVGLGFGAGDHVARQHFELAGELRSRDSAAAEAALSRALESQVSGTPVQWRNPDSGASGTIRPVRTFMNRESQFCREYERIDMSTGRSEAVTGIACRDDTGTWRTRAVFFGK